MTAPYQESAEEVAKALDVDVKSGLDVDQVEARRERHGPNRMKESEHRSWWEILFDQFKSLVVGLLLLAGAISAAVGQLIEAAAILAAVLADVAIGFVTEIRARESVEALRELEKTTARVRRDGDEQEIRSADLVPGDLVLLEAGELVPADVRLIDVSSLEVDESPLTGESTPVRKEVELLEGELPAGERSNMAFKGTSVTRGTATGVVVATGMETEIGHISEMVETAEVKETPLERRLDGLGKRLIWITAALAGLVVVAGFLAGREMILIIETAIVLGVAAVPEGLPIVASLALARGVRRMARRNALVKRLSSVETLGSAQVILTDKTGTLTEGRMRVAKVVTAHTTFALESDTSELLDNSVGEALVKAAIVCTDGDLDEDKGDPMDLALLELGRNLDRTRESLLDGSSLIETVPFDSDSQMMATFYGDEAENDISVAVKGAPEAVLEASNSQGDDSGESPLDDDERDQWLERNDELAREGLRVVAVGRRQVEEMTDQPYSNLTLLGLVGFWDPPRDGIVDSVEECRGAGIRVVMVTGDHAVTARNIAQRVGIAGEDTEVVSSDDVDDPDEEEESERDRLREIDVFARVTPENKLDLITLHQQAGTVVAMTGDGINDAPALEKANIGIAMGKRGTQVAREAADIVLLDDAFSTIVTAIRYGRTVFTNIRKFVVFLLSGNLAEILAVVVATLAGLPLPLLPLQILYINFVADVFPALALGFGSPSRDVMAEPPRDPSEPILARRQWVEVSAWGTLIAGTVLGALLIGMSGLEITAGEIASVTFLTFGFARVWHVFNMRRQDSNLFVNEVTTNPYSWAAVAIGVGLMLLAAFFGPLSELLSIGSLDINRWLLVLGASLIPLIVGQAMRSISPDNLPFGVGARTDG